MANIVINTQYKAPSFQEMLAPLSMYTQEYNAIEEGLSDLSTKASVFDKLANEEDSPIAYNMYKNYSNAISGAADTLSKQRLNPGSRKQMLDLKSRYSKDIIPIEQAYQKRENNAKYMQEISSKDNTAMFNPNSVSNSLDSYIKDPNLTPEYLSGAMLTKQTAEQVNNLAKELQENPQKIERLYPGYLQLTQRRGYKREDIQKAFAGDPDADPLLTGIVDKVMESSGLANWGEEAYTRGKEYAKMGLWEGVGTTETKEMSDVKWIEDYKEALRKRAMAEATPPPQESKKYRSVPSTHATQANTTQIKEDLEFLEKAKNGGNDFMEYKINTQGKMKGLPSKSGGYSYEKEIKYPNKEKLKSLYEEYKVEPGNIDQLKKSMELGIKSSAVRHNAYLVDITKSDLLAKQLKENAQIRAAKTGGDTGFYKLDGNKKGDLVSIDDIYSDIETNFSVGYDPNIGIFLNGTTSKGKPSSYVLDPEVVTGESIENPDGSRINAYQDIIDNINGNEDPEEKKHLINKLMNNLYNEGTTISKAQSETDARL